MAIEHKEANVWEGGWSWPPWTPSRPAIDVYEVLGFSRQQQQQQQLSTRRFKLDVGRKKIVKSKRVRSWQMRYMRWWVGQCRRSASAGELDKSINRETMGFSRDFAAGPGGPTPVGFRPIIRPNRKTRGPWNPRTSPPQKTSINLWRRRAQDKSGNGSSHVETRPSDD